MRQTQRGTAWLGYQSLSETSSLRLFCFPHAGGGVAFYRGWQENMPDGIEVIPVSLPGRESRLAETPFRRMRPLVNALAQCAGDYLDKPFAFFGHSMGSLIAFELSRELRRRYGALPVLLFASAYRAPQTASCHAPVYALPNQQFIDHIKRYNGIPDVLLENEELMEFALPILRADFELCDTYRYIPESPLACPITVISGNNDPMVSRSSIEAWRTQTLSDFMLSMLPGDHFYPMSQQRHLLELISAQLLSVISSNGNPCVDEAAPQGVAHDPAGILLDNP